MRLFFAHYLLLINQTYTMKTKIFLFYLAFIGLLSCGNDVTFTPEFMEQTAGRYLYNSDDVIDVYYEDGKMLLKWRGGHIEPLVLDDNEIFLSELYSKLRFVQHPETKERYLSMISKDDESKITYDFLKVEDDFQTPSMYLKEKNYDKAIEGFLAINEKDSLSPVLDERTFNNLGYRLLRREDYDNAIKVFKMNVELFPKSDNVYDSLADGYLRSGDSAQAFEYYSKALAMNPYNMRAEKYLKAYKKEDVSESE